MGRRVRSRIQGLRVRVEGSECRDFDCTPSQSSYNPILDSTWHGGYSRTPFKVGGCFSVQGGV